MDPRNCHCTRQEWFVSCDVKMCQKKSWFSLIKRLFRWDTTQSEQGKKEKRREWLYGRMKVKRLTPIAVPSKETIMLGGEEDEEQRKNALSVKKNSAAIRIQSAFRGYLARKALRALKGIVKLQAIIRGRAVRRQALRSLKCLQSIVSIQSQASASRRLQLLEARSLYDPQAFHGLRDKIIRMDSNGEKRWDDSILLKEAVETSCINKKEALLKRERIKQYSFNHRMSAETERNRVNGRWRYWLEQWVDTQLSKSKELEDLDSTAFSSHYRGEKDNNGGGRSLKLRNPEIQRQINQIEEGLNCHKIRCSSVGREENYSSTSSPVITPTYMAATESAKAKARSISSPRLWAWNSNLATDSDYSYSSPCKKKRPLVSSVNTTTSEVFGSTRIGKLSGSNYKQIFPRLKGTVVSVMNKV